MPRDRASMSASTTRLSFLSTLSKLRAFAKVFVGAVLLSCMGVAQASDWPQKSIKIIVGYPPGGGADTVARQLAAALTTRLGQPVIVENRAGGTGAIAAQAVARATPDGYTAFLAASSEMTIAPATNKTLAYDPEADFTPIAQVARWPYLLVVTPDLPVQNLAQLVTYVKSNPGKVSYASFGASTANHLMGEMFNKQAGLDSLHVPYQGSSTSLVGVMNGQVQYTFDSPLTTLNLVQAGKLKALAVTGKERLSRVNTVPTTAESGMPGLLVEAWMGVFLPAKTPKDVVDKFSAAVSATLNSAAYKDDLSKKEILPGTVSNDDFKKLIGNEIAGWRTTAKQLNIQPN